MEYLSIFCQLLPSCMPAYVNIVFQMIEPASVYTMNAGNLAFPIPAGREIYVLTPGNRRPANEIRLPYFWNNLSVNSRCDCLRNMYFPYLMINSLPNLT